ncbi:MAG: hypothetical protein QOI66_4434 [Myxococcales bacterium]|jgi:hypothetical protein|nr:hypothetical protein [Myxococcales bacterium]
MKLTKEWRPVAGAVAVGFPFLVAALALGGCGESPAAEPPAAFHALVTEQPGILLSAAYTADGNAIIVGGQIAGGEGLLLRWDGRSMTTIPTPGAHAFWWVNGLSPTEMYLAGESGEVHRFDGASLTVVDAGVPATATLFGIWGPSGDELWTVGGSFSNAGAKRIIRHLTGGQWVAVDSPADVPAETTYFKVWGADPSDVWIVGDGGVVLHWDGSTLSRDGRVTGAERFFTVHGCDRQNVWVVGGTGAGEVRSFDGNGWTSVSAEGAQPLNGVSCAGDDVIVGGAFGYAARIAGGKLTAIATPKEVGDLFIHGIARSAGHTLAVGGDLLAGVGDPYRGFVLEL